MSASLTTHFTMKVCPVWWKISSIECLQYFSIPHNGTSVFLVTVFMEIVEEKSRYALQEHLHLITAPLQVIWGKQDQVIPLFHS